jgi:hypothetical protein
MPPGWDATRARILARDGHACRDCGAPATEVHHERPGVERDDLLVSLCSPCHLARTLAQAQAARRAAAAPGDWPHPVTGAPAAAGDGHRLRLPVQAAGLGRRGGGG